MPPDRTRVDREKPYDKPKRNQPPPPVESSTTMDETLPPPPTRITLDTIDAAPRAQAAAAEDGLSFDDIVIAQPVTHRQLDRVPDQWLRGIRVMLRADGALVITTLETRQQKHACGELSVQFRNYAHAHGLRSGWKRPLTRRVDGLDVTPDEEIYRRTRTAAGATREPLVLFEVEVHHRTMPCIIATAAQYLDQLLTVDRVVFFKFFPPQQEALRANQLKVAAMLIVFCRAGGAHTGLMEVAQLCSFGNYKLPGYVARTLATKGGLHVPYAVIKDQEGKAGGLPDSFFLEDLHVELMQLRALENHTLIDVDMPEGLPPIAVDLTRVFGETMLGWDEDRWPPV